MQSIKKADKGILSKSTNRSVLLALLMLEENDCLISTSNISQSWDTAHATNIDSYATFYKITQA